MTSGSDIPGMQEFEYDWLEPSVHETMLIAQSEAVYMQAEQVYPEHFLLGVSIQGDNRAAKILDILGITRERLLSLKIDVSRLGNPPVTGWSADLSEAALPISVDLQKCIYQAIAVAIHVMHKQSVSPEHLVLSVLSHQQIQSFLSPLSLSSEVLLEKLNTSEELKESGLFLEEFFKQTLLASVRGRLEIPGDYSHSLLRVLGSFEHPTTRFLDIPGQGEVKLPMRAMVEFLKTPGTSRSYKREKLQTVLLVGPSGRERKQLVEAVAGEAGVPLISLAFSGLVAAFAAFDDYIERIKEFGPSIKITVQSVPSKRGLDLTQAVLRDFFLQTKYKSPRLFLIDDLDAIVRLGTMSGREQLLDQLIAEIAFIVEDERTIVVATANQLSDLSYVLKHSGFFKLHVLMRLSIPKRTNLCPSCKSVVPVQWYRCAYCGTSLARVCSKCGAPLPEVEGAKFCFECGSSLE